MRGLAKTVIWGAAIGDVVWNRDDVPEPARLSLLALIPVRWGRVSGGVESFALVLSYQLFAMRRIPGWVPSCRDGGADAVVAWAACLVPACVATLPWAALAREPATAAGATFARAVAIQAVSSVPPFGWLCPFPPLLFTAALYPGLGWWGILLGCLTAGACAAAGRAVPRRASCTVLIAAAAAWTMPVDPVAPPSGWYAVDTRLGPMPRTPEAYAQRQRQLADVARAELARGARLVVLPESVAGAWSPAAGPWWDEVGRAARDSGALLVVGTDWPTRAGYVNALKAFGSRDDIVAVATVVVPPLRWGAWRDGVTLPGGGAANGRFELDGIGVAVLFCVEELLPWPALSGFGARRPTRALVAVANHGWLDSAPSIPHQALVSRAWARLFGVALLRADNARRDDAS